MSVTLSPSSQLAFQRPLTQLVKRTLSVSNHNSQPIVYKVKTTAPKQYCVRPNSGRIEPGETVEVQVLLQPMKEDPAPGAKCRDKFLVQSVVVTLDRESSSLAELWAAVEKEDKASVDKPSLIHEQKIRCAYLPAAEDGTNGANGTIHEEESTPSSSKFATVRSTSSSGTPTNGASTNPEQSFTSTLGTPPTSSSPSAGAAPDSPSPTSVSAHTSPLLDQAQSAVSQAGVAAGGVVAGAAAAVGLTGVATAVAEKSGAEVLSTIGTKEIKQEEAPLPMGEQSLRTELASARLEIASLRKQLASSESTAAGLRSRGVGEKVPVSSGGAVPGTAQAVVQEKGSEGVPVQVVVGIAVAVFVVTWALF